MPEWNSDTNQHISVHEALIDWTSDANRTTYDGSNNWSSSEIVGLDNGPIIDVQEVNPTHWMTLDVTELVQRVYDNGETHLSLMLIGDDNGGIVKFASTNSSTNKPWLNLTWQTENATFPQSSGNPVSPSNNTILWNNSTVALLPSGQPTLSWQYNSSDTINGWRLYILNDPNDERKGWEMYDSSIDSGFNNSALTWSPSIALSSGESYKWFVQPSINGTLGSRSGHSVFALPTQTGGAYNSTDAWLEIQEGGFVSDSGYPAIFEDTWLDSSSTQSNYANDDELFVGRSPTYHTSSSFKSQSIIEIDISSLPIAEPFEITEASLSLYRLTGQTDSQNITIAGLNRNFTENQASWAFASSGTPWSGSPADAVKDSDLINNPDIDIVRIDGSGWFEFNVTQLMQLSRLRGDDTLRVILYGVWSNEGYQSFASSEYTNDTSRRPKLNISWRAQNSWIPEGAYNLDPLDGGTTWNLSAELPTPSDEFVLSWNLNSTNYTDLILQVSGDSTFGVADPDENFYQVEASTT